MTIEEQLSVAEDRKNIIELIHEFDTSDRYHPADEDTPDTYDAGYYDAIDRVVALLRGDIKDWTSPRPEKVGRDV